MDDTVTVGYADLTQLSKDLAVASGQPFKQVAGQIVQDSAIQVQTFARAYAPRRTGALAEGILVDYSAGGLVATIYPTAKYAIFMEFGTASRGEYGGDPYIIVPKRAKYLRFVINGKVIYTKKVVHPGVAPRPFMRPAVERIALPMSSGLADAATVFIVHGPYQPTSLSNPRAA